MNDVYNLLIHILGDILFIALLMLVTPIFMIIAIISIVGNIYDRKAKAE
jgi:hypothetical protein